MAQLKGDWSSTVIYMTPEREQQLREYFLELAFERAAQEHRKQLFENLLCSKIHDPNP